MPRTSLKKAFNGQIRAAVAADIDDVVAIEAACYPADERYPRSDLEGCIEQSQRSKATPFIVADPASDEKGPAGYVLGLLQNGDGIVASLSVTPAYEGHGLGRALLERVEKSLIEAGAKKLVLQVRVDNDNAKHLYESDGFKQTKVLPKYYGDADAYEMVKPVARKSAAPAP